MRPRLQTLLSGNVVPWLIIAGGAAYVLLAGWMMAATPYDTWGVLVAIPFAGAIAVLLARSIFRGEFAELRRMAMVGIIAKLGGTLARYWVANDAYGGSADSNEYHRVGKVIAGELWHGQITIVELMPHTQGTRFIGEVTGLLYSIVGGSKLAGFVWFGMLGYLGVALTVKAGCLAIPGLARAKYAWLCFLLPSLVFWPSSIGKEAWMSFVLGGVSMGAARIFRGDGARRGLPWLAAGLLGAAMVRPHLAVIWLAAFAVALGWSALTGRVVGTRRVRPARVVALAVVAVITLNTLSQATVRYLNPAKEVGASVSDILGMTSRRTSVGGSRFDPIVVNTPLDYPYAVLRTLSRPLFYEANTLSVLLPALETTFLVGLMLLARRRLAGIPSELMRSPYVLYALLICIMGALAFSTFGNLAILVRQRSLLLPSLLLPPCLPVRAGGQDSAEQRHQPAQQRSAAAIDR